MGTAVAIPDVPAHLAVYAPDDNAGAAGGIKAGSWPRISIGGSKFSVKEGGETSLICDPTNPDLPKMQLELVLVGHNPSVSKTYYEGDYEEGDKDEPTCSSDDGITPDDHIALKQSAACATCKQNAWGSKISRVSGKQIKACSDNKRLVFIRADDLSGPAYEFSVKPASLKDWAAYVKELDSKRIALSTVVTLVYFDPAATYPKCLFKFGRYLTAEEAAIAAERKTDEDVKLIASPRRTGPNLPAGSIPIVAASPLPAAQPVAPTPPVTAAQAPAAPAPAPAPAPVDPFAGLPDYVKQAVDGAGGLATEPGRNTYKVLTGKDAPPLAQPVATPPPPPPVPVDPYAGQPPHVKLAVDGAGGLDSEAGRNVYKTLTQKDAPGAAPAAAPAKARGRKATNSPAAPPAPAIPAPAAPAPAASPAPAPTPQFSAAPEANVVAPGASLDIEALLQNALNQPAPAPGA